MLLTRRNALGLALTSVVVAACGSTTQSTSEPAAPSEAPTTVDAVATPTNAESSVPAETSPSTVAASVETVPATESTSTPPAETVAAPPAATEVPESLDLSAPLVGGGEIDFRSYAGKPLALWFWAPG